MAVGPFSDRWLNRRSFLLGALGVTSASLLAACGGGGAASPTSAPAAQPTKAPAAAAPTSASAAPTTAAAAPTTVAAAPTAAAGGAATSAPAAGSGSFSKDKAPPFAGAANAKQFASQKITYYGDSVGIGAELDQVLAKQFTADTGIAVNVVPKPQSATENYSTYQRFFQASSPDVDVMMVDVIWPGAFAAHLVDLTEKLGTEAKQHYPNIVENNTVDNKLVAVPWFGDFGMLFYRTDLLQKAGFSGPPKTWDELGEQAQKIVDGEKGANPNFAGFVYQGNAYEGLTCDALEWLASSGGGQIIEDGKVTLGNPASIEILNKLKGWVGTVSPRGVTSYQEEDARNVFQGGNAAFMRNWPYAYALAGKDDSPIKGKFDVAPLPAQSGQKPAGTVGGWQLAVSKYSKSQEASIEFVRYMTSPEVETWRAVIGSFVPTIQSVAENADVVKAEPFLANLKDVVRVTRPSSTTGEHYNEVSTAFFQAVNQILNGGDAATILPQATQRITRLTG